MVVARDPYCGNCGYSLRGLTESSKCPECGKPIVEVLQRDRSIPRGKRYKSKTMPFGLLAVGGAAIGLRAPCDGASGGAVMG